MPRAGLGDSCINWCWEFDQKIVPTTAWWLHASVSKIWDGCPVTITLQIRHITPQTIKTTGTQKEVNQQ